MGCISPCWSRINSLQCPSQKCLNILRLEQNNCTGKRLPDLPFENRIFQTDAALVHIGWRTGHTVFSLISLTLVSATFTTDSNAIALLELKSSVKISEKGGPFQMINGDFFAFLLRLLVQDY